MKNGRWQTGLGGLGEGVGGGQDKASTVSHRGSRQLRFCREDFSRGARTARRVRTVSPEIRAARAEKPPAPAVARRLFRVAAFAFLGAILIGLVGRALRDLGLVLAVSDSASPPGIYRLVTRNLTRGALVESCLPDSIARFGIARGYLHSGDCDGVEPVVKIVAALPGDLVQVSPRLARRIRRIASSDRANDQPDHATAPSTVAVGLL